MNILNWVDHRTADVARNPLVFDTVGLFFPYLPSFLPNTSLSISPVSGLYIVDQRMLNHIFGVLTLDGCLILISWWTNFFKIKKVRKRVNLKISTILPIITCSIRSVFNTSFFNEIWIKFEESGNSSRYCAILIHFYW